MTTLHTDRGDQIMSSADYASAITCRRPSHWPATLVLIAVMWVLVGIWLFSDAPTEQQEAVAVAADKADAILAAQLAGIPPANK